MRKLILLDDHLLFLDTLKVALGRHHGFDVVGVAQVEQFYPAIEREKPDLVVIDVMLGESNGAAVLRELRRRNIRVPALMLTLLDNLTFVREAFEAGADGYALKSQPLSEILTAIGTVADGARYIAPALGSIPESDPARRQQHEGDHPFDRLSRREREVLGLIIAGASSRSIARDLSISVKTVETHRTHINRKLDVRSPAELIRVAALKGMLTSAGSKTIPDPEER
jgi:DNA-binding NarL/FixJ family response regulator